MAKGVNRITELAVPLSTRYGVPVVYDKYPLDRNADGRGATSPVDVNDIPPVEGAADTTAQMEYLAAQRPPQG